MLIDWPADFFVVVVLAKPRNDLKAASCIVNCRIGLQAARLPSEFPVLSSEYRWRSQSKEVAAQPRGLVSMIATEGQSKPHGP